MRRKLLVAISLLLAACSNSPALTPSPTGFSATSTATAVFTTAPNTSTPLPPTKAPQVTLSVLTATATSYASLQTDGPYFVYFKQQDDKQFFVILDENGQGRQIVPMPPGSQLPINQSVDGDLKGAIAPNGKWLAFYTGTAGEDGLGPYNLALNLMNTSTGEVTQLTELLSNDYPANFEKLDEIYADNEYYSREGNYRAFFGGLRSLAWSPDARYLAFVGEMDGPSSDVYVYDTQTTRMQRLSSGNEHIQSVEWSPNGKWIVHESAFERSEGDSRIFHAASIDGSIVKTLSSSTNGIYGWLSPTIWLEADGSNGRGTFRLRSVNIETGHITVLWSYSFSTYVVDRETSTLLLSAMPQTEFDLGGLYVINGRTGTSTMIDGGPIWEIHSWTLDGIPFIAQNQLVDDQQTLLLTSDGSTTPIDAKWFGADVSPDNKWIITNSEIYDSNLQFVGKVEFPSPIDTSSWTPDAIGKFIVSGSDLYFVSIPEGQIRLIDQDVPEKYHFEYTWVSGK